MSVSIGGYSNPYLQTLASDTSSGPQGTAGSSTKTGSNTKANESSGNNDNKDPDPKTEDTEKTGEVIDAVFGDASDKQVSMEDFLTLMVAQLKNQDFMNPVDDTQYVTQLAQISTMQQMEEMAYNSKSTYASSLVGKIVTAAKITVEGKLDKEEGVVDKVSLLDGKFVFYVNDKAYSMDQIMEVKTKVTPPADNNGDNQNDGNKGDDDKDGSGGSNPSDGV